VRMLTGMNSDAISVATQRVTAKTAAQPPERGARGRFRKVSCVAMRMI
jgi:hypothetical protein